MERLEKQKLYLTGLFAGKGMYKAIEAMHLALEFHTGKRQGGEAEVSHQFELVSYAVPLFEDSIHLEKIVCICFLHDIVEDYNYSQEQLVYKFGEDITKNVVNVSKPVNFKKEAAHYERYYSYVSSSPLSMIVKLIDRLHNFESMLNAPEIFTFTKRVKYMEEVETYMIPSAKLVRSEYPEHYQKITFLIRLLKTYMKFIKEYNEASK